jgi:hypothetical protein
MNSTAPKLLFTVEEANKRLPLVKSIVKDIVELFSSVNDRRERLERLRSNRTDDDVYSEELDRSEDELQKDVERLQEYIEELQTLGVELKDPAIGLVDFRTLVEGREAYLCWRLGEEEIAFWHELKEGAAGRQSLLDSMLSSENFGSDDEDDN